VVIEAAEKGLPINDIYRVCNCKVRGFIYRTENYPGPIAIDCKPSKECDEYHKNSRIQINLGNIKE
jgi:hypothetical protein